MRNRGYIDRPRPLNSHRDGLQQIHCAPGVHFKIVNRRAEAAGDGDLSGEMKDGGSLLHATGERVRVACIGDFQLNKIAVLFAKPLSVLFDACARKIIVKNHGLIA